MYKRTILTLFIVGLMISAFTTINRSELNHQEYLELSLTQDTIREGKLNPDSLLPIRTAELLNEDWDFDLLSTYSMSAPGTSERYGRAFENAPPMIPHMTTGLLPITKDMNMCLTCHMPAIAVAMKSTPIPESHFMKYRPIVNPEDVVREEVLVYTEDLNGQLDQARYNCTLCHAAQANITVVFDNEFMPQFRTDDSKKRSYLHQNIGEGVK
ncbi:MAG: nitrate reductase cytochrome c-type subunit [Bacteroidales bacterium]|nr:nitrate reductase cytochrome c-type subunit [Bacteroidales bacterium]